MHHRSKALAIAFSFCVASATGKPLFSEDVNDWEEVPVPASSDAVEYCIWLRAANTSPVTWHVRALNGRALATQHAEPAKTPRFGPVTVGKGMARGGRAVKVDDGWLVAFNQGEFGAAVYWFSVDGTRSYEVSSHHVVQFASLPKGLHAIQGLSHGPSSDGTLIRFAKRPRGMRWHAVDVARLPGAPYTAVKRRDGTLLVILDKRIVSIDSRYRIRTLLSRAPMPFFSVTSSALARDETFLYVGMRQFVVQVNLPKRTVRYLVPSRTLVSKLTTDEETPIRQGKHRCEV